ncbi:alpha-glucuronidase [Aureococcus anophagefferens]|nr:alpha-glucuronidase [Aureococcus anophagefferens]
MRDPPAALAASRVASSLETGGPASPATTYKPDPKRGKGAGLPGSDDLYLDAALGALNVGVGAEGRPLPSITSTPTVAFKRSRFAGHAAPVASVGDVEFVVAALKGAQRCVPYAYRLAGGAPGAPPEGAREGRDDGGDVGVGDKLLHLLTQWDVENVVLVVTRDDSKSIVGGEALGVRRFKIVIDCAKSVLELCYLDSLRRTLRVAGSGPSRDVDSCGIPLTRALGRVNNFRHGFDAQRESPSKIVAMRPLDDETPTLAPSTPRDDDDGGASGPAPSPAAYDDEGFGLPRSAVATALPMPRTSTARCDRRSARCGSPTRRSSSCCAAWRRSSTARGGSCGSAAAGRRRAPPYDVDWVGVRFA